MSDDLTINKKLDVLELLFNSMPFTYIFWKNREGVYLGANSNQIAIFGRNGKDFIGKTIYEILDYESAKAIDEIDTKLMQDGVPVTVEESLTTPQGEQRVFLSQKQPIRNHNNEIIGLLGFSLDITERKKMEDDLRHSKELAEAANKAKTEFLENMRHDIRTPLTGIVGFSELLQSEFEDNRVKEYAGNLIASSHALLHLLDEVLEMIRLSSGELPALKKKFRLQDVLEHVVALNRAKAAQKNLALELNYDASISPYLLGDKVRIHRIALELVANALNFTETGFVKLKAELAQQKPRESIIKLIVEDSGIGIPKDKQQEIYLQFKRLTPSYQGIYKGIGLGLSVVKQFIDELEGEIYVESDIQQGTKFTCIIPLQKSLLDDDFGLDTIQEESFKAVDAPPVVKTSSAQITESEPIQSRILIVEDNAIAQIIAKSIVTKLNYAADIAGCGEKALELWKRNSYDLIFMDIGLPDLSGYEVTHRIRLQELPQKSHVPIIALTAHLGDEDKKRCLEAGMNAVITKPLTEKVCLETLNAFIPGNQKKPNSSEQLVAEKKQMDNHWLDLSSFPLLDINEGIKTLGDKAILKEMLLCLIHESIPADCAKMEAAHAQGDWNVTQQLAHKIKSGAMYVGTIKLKMACQYLERYWKEGQRELLEALYQQVLVVIASSCTEIKQKIEDKVL